MLVAVLIEWHRKNPVTPYCSLCSLMGQPGGCPYMFHVCSLAYFFAPRFEVFLYLGHELIGYCAIDQAMVVA